MSDDKIVEVVWSNPPQVECPYHQSMLRSALINKAGTSPKWKKLLKDVAGKIGCYRRGVYTVGGVFLVMMVMDGASGVSGYWWDKMDPESRSIQASIIRSIDDLEAKDKLLVETKTGLDLVKVQESVKEGTGFKKLGSQKMSPQLVWDLAVPALENQMTLAESGQALPQEMNLAINKDSSVSGGVEMVVVSYRMSGEEKWLGLTKGMVPLLTW